MPKLVAYAVYKNGRYVRSFPSRDQAVNFCLHSGEYEDFEILDQADLAYSR